MTKDEALLKIKELEQFIRDESKPKLVLNIRPRTDGGIEANIGPRWLYTAYGSEQQGRGAVGSKKAGRAALMFLSDNYGTWYDSEGCVISGYMFFKPQGEV